MFYSENILSKKGPLAGTWLAAHWEKKLSKTQIFQTDIPSAVEQVKTPGAPLALRLSGQLLLGVVRIYSRKAKYLLEDCGEVITKIKIAFVQGDIDLPAGKRDAPLHTITLPENLMNVDLLLPDPQLDLQFPFLPFDDGGFPSLSLADQLGPSTTFDSIERGRDASTTVASNRSEITMEPFDASKRDDMLEFDQFGAEPMEQFPLDTTKPHDADPSFLDDTHFPMEFEDTNINVMPPLEEVVQPEPPTPGAAEGEASKPAKKRKFVVDDKIDLDEAAFKKLIDNATELTAEQTFLPASKKLLVEAQAEHQSLEAMFASLPIYGLSSDLVEEIKSNMELQPPPATPPQELAREDEPLLPAFDEPTDPFDTTLGGDSHLGELEPEREILEPKSPGLELEPQDLDLGLLPVEPEQEGEQEGEEPETEPSAPTGVSGGLSKQTVKVMDFLRREFADKESSRGRDKSLSTEQLFTGKDRKTVATTFFEVLVLRTRGFIDVEQEEPYSDIRLTAREKLFNS